MPEVRILDLRAEPPGPATANRLARQPDCSALVSGFSALERLVALGVDSRRVLVAGSGEPFEDSDSVESSGSVPQRPHVFPWQSCVVVPTYNERDNLESIVSCVLDYVDTDILVVDDNSPDGTADVARRLMEELPALHLLCRETKDGLGRAYVAGFRWALERGYSRILEMDADGSHPPWDLPRLLAASRDADVVVGSRWVPGGTTEGWSRRRELLSRAANSYSKIFLGGGVRDWTGGFRCFRAETLERIDLEGITSAGYSFQIEMLWRALGAGARVRELPICFRERRSGTSKMNWRIAWEALRLVPSLRVGTN